MGEMCDIYDPHHEYFKGHDPVNELKAQRNKRAQIIWSARQRCRKVGLSSIMTGIIALTMFPGGSPMKPTTDNLRQRARDLWEYTTGPINHGYDTEYYSACGMDDYIGERKDSARSEALAIWRVVGRFD